MEEESYVPSVFDAAVPLSIKAATKGQRLVNFLVDTALCFVLFPPFRFLLRGALANFGIELDSDGVPFFVELFIETIAVGPLALLLPFLQFTAQGWILVLLIPLYYTLVESATGGRSLGKLITRTIAIRADEAPFRLKDAALRGLCRLIPVEPLSAFGRMPWHDRLTKTRVIQKPPTFLPSQSPLPGTSTIYDIRP